MAASMFERYGGFASIRRIVSAFYDAVLDSPLLSHHFEHADMRSLIEHQTQFISYLTGGPGTNYSDEVLQRVHASLGITKEEFKEMRVLLREALEDHDFADADVEIVDALIEAREPVIVSTS